MEETEPKERTRSAPILPLAAAFLLAHAAVLGQVWEPEPRYASGDPWAEPAPAVELVENWIVPLCGCGLRAPSRLEDSTRLVSFPVKKPARGAR